MITVVSPLCMLLLVVVIVRVTLQLVRAIMLPQAMMPAVVIINNFFIVLTV